jgi:hypothetical protein
VNETNGGFPPVLVPPTVLSASSAKSPESNGAYTATWSTRYGGGTNSKVHVESSVTGFETITGAETRKIASSTPGIDIGSIIGTLFPPSTTYAAPTVHPEEPVSGWETGYPSYSDVHTSSAAAHVEKPTTGWEESFVPPVPTSVSPGGHHEIPASQNNYEPGKPGPNEALPTQQQSPSKPGGVQPPMTTTPTTTITEYPPPPAVTHDGITIQPTAITRKSTITLPDGALTMTESVEFQVAVGSSTLNIGTPVTVNNVVVGLTTDAAGSTVLHAGDMTTTLPKPVAGAVRTVTEDAPGRLNIVTGVIDGTTKYIFAGQTLAPGQPVTIGDTPISIATSDGNTVLYVGDKSTTLAPDGSVKTFAESASDIRTETHGTATNTGPAGASASVKKAGSSLPKKADAALACLAMSALFMFTA